MKNSIITFLILFTTMQGAWNTPFIDTDETLELKYGMPKEDVLDVLGYPLYVEKGWPDGKSNEIIWIYEIRTTDVASNISTSGEVNVVKSSSSKKPNGVVHKLKLTFNNNKLNHWEPLVEDKVSGISMLPMPSLDVASVAVAAASSKKPWSIHPKISMVSESWEVYDYDGEEDGGGGVRFGVNIGKSMFGMNVGADISFGSGTGFMLFVDKKMFGFHWIASIGTDVYDEYYEAVGGFKIGVFKDISTFSVGLETMARSADHWNYDMGNAMFITLKYKLRG